MQTGTALRPWPLILSEAVATRGESSLGGKDRRGSTYQPLPGVAIAKSCTEVGGCEIVITCSCSQRMRPGISQDRTCSLEPAMPTRAHLWSYALGRGKVFRWKLFHPQTKLGLHGPSTCVLEGDTEGRGGTFRSSWYLVILWTGLIR